MIHVIASVELHPNTRDRFLQEFAQVVPPVRAEYGCIEYGAAIDLASGIAVQIAIRPDVVAVEKWSSPETLSADHPLDGEPAAGVGDAAVEHHLAGAHAWRQRAGDLRGGALVAALEIEAARVVAQIPDQDQLLRGLLALGVLDGDAIGRLAVEDGHAGQARRLLCVGHAPARRRIGALLTLSVSGSANSARAARG